MLIIPASRLTRNTHAAIQQKRLEPPDRKRSDFTDNLNLNPEPGKADAGSSDTYLTADDTIRYEMLF